jgi:hypothetical protein
MQFVQSMLSFRHAITQTAVGTYFTLAAGVLNTPRTPATLNTSHGIQKGFTASKSL